MTQLAADSSPGLLTLLEQDARVVDAIKVGPWMTDAQLEQAKALKPVIAHFALSACRPISPEAQEAALILARKLESPWFSLHLGLDDGMVRRIFDRLTLPFPLVRKRKANVNAVRALGALRRSWVKPVLAENEALPFSRAPHSYLGDPDFIKAAIESTGSHLLLDLAHARVTAASRGEDVRAYLKQLPLHAVLEIHISGPRLVNGVLRDVHETLQEEDYNLLSYALENCSPRAVTLEYWRDPVPLMEQLVHLRTLVN